MTREEAANWLEHYCYGNTNILRECDDDLAEKIQTAMDEAIAALRGPQPDPITGLARCGCGGITEQTDFHDGCFPYSKVECLECGIQMMRAGDTFLEAHAEVKRDWNTAMGWKGGAE